MRSRSRQDGRRRTALTVAVLVALVRAVWSVEEARVAVALAAVGLVVVE